MITADNMRRLAALNLPASAFKEVLSILADMQAVLDAHVSTETARKSRDRERKFLGKSKENPRTIQGKSQEIPGKCQTAPLSNLLTSSNSLQEEGLQVAKKEERKSVRGFRLPDDWSPDAQRLEFAESRGFVGQSLRDEITKFKNHWANATGKGSAKPRWDKAFENWILNAVKFNGGQNGARPNSFGTNRGPGPQATNADAIFAGMARVAEKRRGGEGSGDRSGRQTDVRGCPDASKGNDADRTAADGDPGTRFDLELVAEPDAGK